MKILIVTQYFWPENFRINDLCSELVQKGHEVTVLTGEPNYPAGFKYSEYIENKNDFATYNGCHIVRVPIVSRGTTSVRLVMNYISYFLSASSLGIWRLRKKRFDIIFVCQLSPITIALPALLYKKIYSVPVVMWVLDLWPDSLRAVDVIRSEWVLTCIGRLARFIYDRCDLILAQSKSIVQAIKNNSSSRVDVKYFPSWSEDVFDLEPSCLQSGAGTDVLNILFAGNIGEAQDFGNVIKSLALVKRKGLKFRFSIVGDGRALAAAKLIVESYALDDVVEFCGRKPLGEMPGLYATADILFVSLKSDPVFSMTIPGKVQSYMMAGKPILAALDGDGAQVILDAGCGLVASPGDIEDLALKMGEMLDMDSANLVRMGSSGKNYALKEFNRSNLISGLIDCFSVLAKIAK